LLIPEPAIAVSTALSHPAAQLTGTAPENADRYSTCQIHQRRIISLKKRKTELPAPKLSNSVLISRSAGHEDRKIIRKQLLASHFRSSRQLSTELHRDSFFTAASTESNGHDSGSKNDSALHSLSPVVSQ
jgi:hypothetical protein